MSETPTIPVLDQKSEQTIITREQRHQYGHAGRELARFERGVDAEARFHLDLDDPLNPELWTSPAGSTVEAPAEAAPRTRAEEIEQPLFYMTKEALVLDAKNVSHAVIELRRLYDRGHALAA